MGHLGNEALFREYCQTCQKIMFPEVVVFYTANLIALGFLRYKFQGVLNYMLFCPLNLANMFVF